jgi:hypothetical protein
MRTKMWGAAAALLLAGAGSAHASVILSEGFESVVPSGWVAVNNSTPGGATGWFQGNPGVFGAQGGADDSYAAANFLNAGEGGAISNWLIAPELAIENGTVLRFYTRSNGAFADRLEVRFSAGSGVDVGSSTASVGTFTTLLLTLNPALNPGGFPTDWTLYELTLNLGATSGRLAFRYSIDDTFVNGDYIGIDTVSVETAAAVPEPGTLGALALGGLVLVSTLRRKA